jgi:uncharacterized membrane protein YfcA
MDFSYSIAGFVVGAIVGFTGVGGGSLMTPLLVIGFHVSPVTAVGTDLLYAAFTKMGGAATHGWKGTVDWRIAGRLAAGSLPGAAITLLALSQFGVRGNGANALVSTSLGLMLVATALAIAFRGRLHEWASRSGFGAWTQRHQLAATIAAGAFLGVAVTISSVGAGAVGVTALLLLYPALATVRIVGTDIAHAVPLTLAAGLGHAWFGNVDWAMLGALLVGSLPGIVLGSHFAVRLPERAVRRTLAALLLFAGAKLVLH